MKRKLKSTIHISSPMIQEVVVKHRYDKKWKTNFVSIYCSEFSSSTEKVITEEMTICFNTKSDIEQFISILNAIKEKFK